MSDPCRRAVAIGLSDAAVGSLLGPMGEAGYALCGRAPDGPGGLLLVRRTEPELAVAAAVMPGMDGVAFARALGATPLNLRPMVLVARPGGLRLPGEEGLADVGATALDMPVSAEGLRAALALLADRPLPPQARARLAALMDALGVPRHPGRDCLERAVALVWADRRRLRTLKQSVYPALSRQTGLSPAQAERAMRHAIDAAWRTGAIEEQHRIFGDTIDARRGKPTCGEMIAQLAEKLRWEGRA